MELDHTLRGNTKNITTQSSPEDSDEFQPNYSVKEMRSKTDISTFIKPKKRERYSQSISKSCSWIYML